MALPDKQSYAALAGNKDNYALPEDPTTDLPAEAGNETRVDVAQMTRMVGRCYVAFHYDSPNVVVDEHDAVWGNAIAVKPGVVRTGGGEYEIEWPSTVADERAVVRALNLRRGWGNVEEAGLVASVKRTGPNTADVSIYDVTTGAPADPVNAAAVVVMV